MQKWIPKWRCRAGCDWRSFFLSIHSVSLCICESNLKFTPWSCSLFTKLTLFTTICKNEGEREEPGKCAQEPPVIIITIKIHYFLYGPRKFVLPVPLLLRPFTLMMNLFDWIITQTVFTWCSYPRGVTASFCTMGLLSNAVVDHFVFKMVPVRALITGFLSLELCGFVAIAIFKYKWKAPPIASKLLFVIQTVVLTLDYYQDEEECEWPRTPLLGVSLRS